MTVICIRGANPGSKKVDQGKIVLPDEAIYEGQTYTVTDEFTDDIGTWYFLKERDALNSYNKNRFIECSEIDEAEMMREPKEVEHA